MTPEQKGPQEGDNIEVVRLNQKFDVFPEQSIFSENPSRKSLLRAKSYSNRVKPVLMVSDGLAIPFDPHASPNQPPRVWSLTPFNPELGYRISNEDYDLEKRKQKLGSWDLNEEVDFSKAPLNLHMFPLPSQLIKSGILLKNTDLSDSRYSIKFELLPIIKRLRLQLFFPKGIVCEARPDSTQLSWGTINFNIFYPVDGGPLATQNSLDTSDPLGSEGLLIMLPADEEKLKQIKGRFILLPEQEDSQDEDLS